jgi:hypothetical protein
LANKSDIRQYSNLNVDKQSDYLLEKIQKIRRQKLHSLLQFCFKLAHSNSDDTELKNRMWNLPGDITNILSGRQLV